MILPSHPLIAFCHSDIGFYCTFVFALFGRAVPERAAVFSNKWHWVSKSGWRAQLPKWLKYNDINDEVLSFSSQAASLMDFNTFLPSLNLWRCEALHYTVSPRKDWKQSCHSQSFFFCLLKCCTGLISLINKKNPQGDFKFLQCQI